MTRCLSFAAFAAALVVYPLASRADVIPFSTTTGYVYSSDGSAMTSLAAHYDQGSGPLHVNQGQSQSWGTTGFAAKSERTGSQVSLGAKATSSGAPAGHSTYVGGSATYSARVGFTEANGGGMALSTLPDKATFQVALNGTIAGGDDAWFSLFNNGSGVYGTGDVGSLWASGNVSHNLQYVENANGGYTVSGLVDFTVDLNFADLQGYSALLQLSLDAGASSVEGLEAIADFMDTATLIGITFPDLDGQSADELGWLIDFTELPIDIVAFDDLGPRGGSDPGGSQTPEPASLAVWGAAAALFIWSRRRQAA